MPFLTEYEYLKTKEEEKERKKERKKNFKPQ